MKTLIETERLLLREITLDDKEELFMLHADPVVQKYTREPVVESIEEIEKAIRTRISNYEKYGFGRWATILKSEMQFVGWAGLAIYRNLMKLILDIDSCLNIGDQV